jgi:hypothetical protein
MKYQFSNRKDSIEVFEADSLDGALLQACECFYDETPDNWEEAPSLSTWGFYRANNEVIGTVRLCDRS